MTLVGWDVFSLHYDVGQPLSVILTPSSMEAYLRIFRFAPRLAAPCMLCANLLEASACVVRDDAGSCGP